MNKKTRAQIRLEEIQAHIDLNYDDDYELDAEEHAMQDCGQDGSGVYCSKIGSEFCDWECPFSDELYR